MNISPYLETLADGFSIANSVFLIFIAVITAALGYKIGSSGLKIQKLQANEQMKLTKLEMDIRRRELEIGAKSHNLASANIDLDRRIENLESLESRCDSQDELKFEIRNDILDAEMNIGKTQERIEQLKKRLAGAENKLLEYDKERRDVSVMIIRNRGAIGHLRNELQKMHES